MSRGMDEYKHLDDDTPFIFSFDSDQIAKIVCNTNYGVHRLLCAIIKERKFLRIRAIINGDDFPDELADGIEALINKDLF